MSKAQYVVDSYILLSTTIINGKPIWYVDELLMF